MKTIYTAKKETGTPGTTVDDLKRFREDFARSGQKALQDKNNLKDEKSKSKYFKDLVNKRWAKRKLI